MSLTNLGGPFDVRVIGIVIIAITCCAANAVSSYPQFDVEIECFLLQSIPYEGTEGRTLYVDAADVAGALPIKAKADQTGHIIFSVGRYHYETFTRYVKLKPSPMQFPQGQEPNISNKNIATATKGHNGVCQ